MTGLMSLGHTRDLRSMRNDTVETGGPGDPALFASTVLDTAIGGKTEEALKLYDQGVSIFGPGFTQTYNAMRDQRDASDAKATKPEPGVLSKVVTAVGDATGLPPARSGEGLLSMGGSPSTRRGPAVDDNAPVELPDELPFAKTPDRPLAVAPLGAPAQTRPEPPEPAPYLPQGADAAVANMLRETEQAGTQYKADRQAAANTARANTLGAATLDAKALVEAGMSPQAAVTEALKQPGVADVVTAGELSSALGIEAPPAQAPAPAPAPTLAATTGLPGTDPTGGYGAGALSGLPAPAPAPTEPDPSFSFKTSQTGQTGQTGGVPRLNRPIVASRNSGGISSLAGPAPAPAPVPGPPVPLTPPPAAASAAASAAAPAADSEEAPTEDKNRYWEALIQAGLGTMASQNSSFLGAVGEGGMQGVKQLGEIRKEMRQEKEDASEAAYRKGSLANQRDNTQVAREGILSQDKRAAAEIQARKDLQTQEITNRNAMLDRQLASTAQLKGMEIGSQRDLTLLRGDIEADLLQRRVDLERQGKQFQYDDAFKRLTDPNGANLPKESAAILASGFAPPKDSARTPMGEKEVTLAFNDAAVTLFGEGYDGDYLKEKIPPQVREEVYAELGKRDNSGSGTAAIIGVLKRRGIVPKDESWSGGVLGTDMTLKVTKPPAPAGNLTYDPANRTLVTK